MSYETNNVPYTTIHFSFLSIFLIWPQVIFFYLNLNLDFPIIEIMMDSIQSERVKWLKRNLCEKRETAGTIASNTFKAKWNRKRKRGEKNAKFFACIIKIAHRKKRKKKHKKTNNKRKGKQNQRRRKWKHIVNSR